MDELFPRATPGRKRRAKPPGYLPSKKPAGKRRYPVVENPRGTHLQLKNYLLSRRLMVERSLNLEVRRELKALDLYIAYLRSLE